MSECGDSAWERDLFSMTASARCLQSRTGLSRTQDACATYTNPFHASCIYTHVALSQFYHSSLRNVGKTESVDFRSHFDCSWAMPRHVSDVLDP